MKKIIIILSMLWGFAEAQTINYTPMTAAGYRFKYLLSDSGFHVPFHDTAINRGATRPGAIVCYTGDSLIYAWNGLRWDLLGSRTQNCNSRKVSGEIVWDSLLTFHSSVIDYYIGCRHFTAYPTILTLDPAYPANDRTDVFYVDTNGIVSWMKGQTNGLKPQVDPASQLEIASVDIGQGDTIPTGFVNSWIYRENIEWVLSGDATGLTGDYLTTPYAGLKSTFVSSFTNGQYIQYTNSDTLDLNDQNYLSFYIRLNTAFDANTFLSVKFQEGAAGRTNFISILNGSYGFNRSTVGSWQPISIPISDFTYSTPDFDGIYFNLSGASAGSFQLDNIKLQGGVTTTTGDFVTSYNGRKGNVVSLRTDNQWAYDSSHISADSLYDDFFVNGVLKHSLWKGLKPVKGDTCVIITRVGDSLHFTFNQNCGGATVTTSEQSITAIASQTAFTFASVPASYNDYMIFVNGGLWKSTTGYTTSGNVVTVTSALDVGDLVVLRRTK